MGASEILYDSYGFKLTSHLTDTTLDHYRFRQNSMAINVEGDWLTFTLSDEATSHAQLALVALTMELELNGSASFVTTKHSSAAVRLIRQKLQRSSGLPEDSLVGAVALLAIVEVSLRALSIS